MTAKPGRSVPREELEGDAIRPGNPLFGAVWINPHRMSGAPGFYGTRVPIRNLFDYLRAAHTIDEFLVDFPGVTREQIEAVLRHAPELFRSRGHAA
jgi:uncharacterized protein (DUF433 family)